VQSGSSSSILRLPISVLRSIYAEVVHPRSQIFLALSCKTFASVAVLDGLHEPPSRTYLSKYGVVVSRRYDYSALIRKLRVIMPDHLHLCHSCWKYLPKQRVWKDSEGRNITTLKKVDWLWAVKEWIRGGKICPSCQIPEDWEDNEGWLQCLGEGVVRPKGGVRVVMVARSQS